MPRLGERTRHGVLGGFKSLGLPARFFGAFATRNVLHQALVVEQFAADLVVHGPSIFRNPDDALVATVDLRFKLRDSSLFAHQADELGPAIRLDVKLMADVGQSGDQLRGRSVSVHAGERRVGADVVPVGRSLKNALDRVFKNAAVFLLSAPQRFGGLIVFLHLLVQRLPKAVVSAAARFEMFMVRTHGIPIGGFTVRRLAGSRELPIK